jgi:hypothetical protein
MLKTRDLSDCILWASYLEDIFGAWTSKIRGNAVFVKTGRVGGVIWLASICVDLCVDYQVAQMVASGFGVHQESAGRSEASFRCLSAHLTTLQLRINEMGQQTLLVIKISARLFEVVNTCQ